MVRDSEERRDPSFDKELQSVSIRRSVQSVWFETFEVSERIYASGVHGAFHCLPFYLLTIYRYCVYTPWSCLHNSISNYIKLSYLYHFIPIIVPYFLYQCHCHPMPSSTIQCHSAEISDFVHEIVHVIVLCVTEVLTSCARVCHCCLHGILSGLERHGHGLAEKMQTCEAEGNPSIPETTARKPRNVLCFNPHTPNSSLDSFLARNLQVHGKFATCTSSSFNAMDLRGLGRVFQNQVLELSPLPAKVRV